MNAQFEGSGVKFLGYSAWLSLKKSALDAMQQALPEPRLADFLQRRVEKYPRELTIAGIVAMIAIALFAFVISAGKEWVVANEVFGSIPSKYGITVIWQVIALVAVLLLGEIGALAFALAASLFGDKQTIRVSLRIASVTCAALALLGNLTLFFLDQHPGELLFEFVITIFPPLTVLAVGMVGEQMLLEHLGARAAAIVAYQMALKKRESMLAEAISSPVYLSALQSLWAVQIANVQSNDSRARVRQLLELDFALRDQLFAHQFRMHEGRYPLSLESGGATDSDARPTQPPK